MFELFEKVYIKTKDLPGTIVDIDTINGKTIYTVESDIEGFRPDGYGGRFPLFDCTDSEISKIE